MNRLKQLALILICTLNINTAFSAGGPEIPYEGMKVKSIVVSFKNQAPGERDDSSAVIQMLGVKTDSSFNQELFDQDLKRLTEEYDWVEPSLKIVDGELVIHLEIKKHPVITRFNVEGSPLKDSKLLKEADLKTGMTYNKENFYKSINKIRDYFIKKGYFKVEVDYIVEQYPSDNEIMVTIQVIKGPKGRISSIEYKGFTKAEKSDIQEMVRVKKYNMFTSWISGSGTIKEEDFDPDVQTIVHYLQNNGYVDAHVQMRIEDRPKDKLALVIELHRGEKYSINKISYSGFTLKDEKTLEKASELKKGDVYSIDKIRGAQERLKELYTKDGYLQTNVDYTMTVIPGEHEYNVNFNIEESDQNRIGLVIVSGNHATRNNVILNSIDFEPGEVYDSRKIKTSQRRLMSTGYFKNVNIYAAKTDDSDMCAPEYRDVIVEVDEAQTGNASLFMGFSSTDNIFGGVDLTENNFNVGGLRNFWFEGPSALRGGGEFLQIKGTVGAREYGVNVSWLDPYLFDSLWRFGVDFDYNRSSVMYDTNVFDGNYSIHAIGGAMSATYPLTSKLSYGFRFRVRDSIFAVPNDAPPVAVEEHLNAGIVSGIAATAAYDSTDNIFKPRRGIRSNFESEFAGLVRDTEEYTDFPFLRFQSFNSVYYPVWKKGTFKLKGDFKFIQPLWLGRAEDFPNAERFYLGGEATIRGYAPGSVGPSFGDRKPIGGISSSLFSAEYAQNIFKPLDVFTFFDAGSISLTPWDIDKVKMSTGVGIRLDIGRQLPFVIGYGYPINPDYKDQEQRLFFSMAGQF